MIKHWKRWLVIVLAALLLIGIGALMTFFLSQPARSVPASVSKQLTFAPFIFTPEDGQEVDRFQLAKAEDGTQTLNYRVTLPEVEVTVTQYVQPSQFNDVPEYKERFLTNVVNQYSTVQTANGVIYLGRAEKQQNKQIGVMLEKGLLVFFNPSKELSEDTWRSIGNNLEIEKTN